MIAKRIYYKRIRWDTIAWICSNGNAISLLSLLDKVFYLLECLV